MGGLRRQLPSPGTLLAGLALVLVIAGGSAYAGSQLARNSVKAKHIAKNAVTNKHTRHMTVAAPKNVRAFEGTGVAAPRVSLLRRGPFSIYGKCYTNGVGTQAAVYLDNKRAGTIGTIGGTVYEGDPPNGYVPVGGNLQLGSAIVAPQDQAVYAARAVNLVAAKKSFRASVDVYLKGGALPAGNGSYGGGKRCVFVANETGTG